MDPSHEDQVLSLVNETNWAPLGTVASFGFFYFCNNVVMSKVVPESVASQGPETTWRFQNVSISFLHSLITGIGTLICLHLHPHLAENILTSYSPIALGLSCFTLGYFIYDFLDMYNNYRKSSTYELLLHHVFAISCFSVPTFCRYYLGYAMIGLLVEVNSIFLHWRQLLLFVQTPKSQLYFRIVSLINLGTFIIFRLVNLSWLIRWTSRNREIIAIAPYILGCSALATVMVMSITLFVKLLRSDYFKVTRPSPLKSKKEL